MAELVQLEALRDLSGDYGSVSEGQVFLAIDDVARSLIQRSLAVRVNRPPNAQAFKQAPELKERKPKVTAIMPTANRRSFLPGAIRSFLGQSYEPKELVIIDDGSESCSDLIPNDPRIQYSFWSTRRSIGAKRNSAIAAATGEIIVHFDDDDRSAPDRIAVQVERLLAGANVSGYRQLEFIDERGQRYLVKGAENYAAGTSLCYWRSWGLANPFPDQNAGEDNAFFDRALVLGDVDIANYDRRIICRIHKGNTVAKRPQGAGWVRLKDKQELPEWANI